MPEISKEKWKSYCF